MKPIRSERDMQRENLLLAWQFSRGMTSEQVDQLCEATAAWMRDEGDDAKDNDLSPRTVEARGRTKCGLEVTA